MHESAFHSLESMMRDAGLSERAIATFRLHWERLRRGESGLLPEEAIRPVPELPDADALGQDAAEAGRQALPRLALVKLNGGLGTSMGLDRAKSLLPVRGELTFLDIIARQVLHARSTTGAGLPLLLMNSFRTERDTLEHLARYPELAGDLPLSFLQHRVPKLDAATLGPVAWPADPELEWCPPGHGDLYLSLAESGLLHRLLERGYEYLFVSNADNLGAVLSPQILGHMELAGLDFLMEAADRTPADRKGGHLALLPDGRLTLREAAQCPPGERELFQDIRRHRFFNTNSIWIRLSALRRLLDENGGVVPLPTIVNRKTVDPRDAASPAVIQLETAMGAAISLFRRSGAVRVPRSRFSPVKTTNDLLPVRSDAYVLTGEFHVRLAPERDEPPAVDLDPEFYKLVDRFDARFPSGPPSLLRCRDLVVRGDVTFGASVVLRGSVRIEASAPARIASGATVEGVLRLP